MLIKLSRWGLLGKLTESCSSATRNDSVYMYFDVACMHGVSLITNPKNCHHQSVFQIIKHQKTLQQGSFRKNKIFTLLFELFEFELFCLNVNHCAANEPMIELLRFFQDLLCTQGPMLQYAIPNLISNKHH